MIVDGLTRFGVPLENFYRQERIALPLMRRGASAPPLSDVAADAEPALAEVNPLPDGSVRWIALCPSCLERGRTSAGYVWLRTPLLFCLRCCNADLGGRWRPVLVPDAADRAEIVRLLEVRPDPETRGWQPGESLEIIRTQNALLLAIPAAVGLQELLALPEARPPETEV